MSFDRRSLLLAAVVAVGAGCATLTDFAQSLEKPAARLRGAELSSLSFDAATLLFDVEIANPHDFALPLSNVDVALSSGTSEPFLKVDLPLDRSIPARGKSNVQVPAETRFLELLAVLKDVRPGSVVPYSADFGISVDVPGLGPRRLPLKTTGELPIPSLPDIELAGIEWGELSLAKATAVMELGIENANTFGIDLDKLGFDLSLGGRKVFTTAVSEQVSLAAGGKRTLRIPFSLSTIEVAKAGYQMLSGRDASYGLNGDFKLGTRFGPLESSFERSGRAPLKR